MAEYGTFEATESERVPSDLLHSGRRSTDAIDRLHAHGVVDDAARDRRRPWRWRSFGSTGTAPPPRGRSRTTTSAPSTGRVGQPRIDELPGRHLRVDMAQPLAPASAFYLLEPRSRRRLGRTGTFSTRLCATRRSTRLSGPGTDGSRMPRPSCAWNRQSAGRRRRRAPIPRGGVAGVPFFVSLVASIGPISNTFSRLV